RTHVVPVPLLVVAHVVLRRRAHALALNAVDNRHRHPRREIWILAEILEIAAAHRRAVNVHAGAENEIHAARARVATHLLAESLLELRVPRSRHRDARRIT